MGSENSGNCKGSLGTYRDCFTLPLPINYLYFYPVKLALQQIESDPLTAVMFGSKQSAYLIRQFSL
jgi:hypothetical protein